MKKDMEELSQALEASQKEVEHWKAGHERAVSESERATKLQVALDKQALLLQQTELRLKDLENERDSYKEWLQQAKLSQKRIAAMPALEREVTSLKSELRNLRAAAHQSQLLEEQVHVLNTQPQSLQPIQQNFTQLQVKYNEIEKEVEEWRFIGNQQDVPTPAQLSAHIDNIQQKDLNLTAGKLEADSQLAKAKYELLTATHDREKVQSKLTYVQNIQKKQEALIHRCQKKLHLVSRERDSYRHQLDCYEKDLTASLAGEGTLIGPAALLPARVDALEKAVQSYRDMVNELEKELVASRADGTPVLQDQLFRLKDQIENLKKDNELLRNRKDQLEITLEKRALKDIELSKTKIIHMTHNPASKAQQNIFREELDKAIGEIVDLRRKVKKLEQNEAEMTQRLSETMHENNSAR